MSALSDISDKDLPEMTDLEYAIWYFRGCTGYYRAGLAADELSALRTENERLKIGIQTLQDMGESNNNAFENLEERLVKSGLENERLKGAVEYAKKIMISARSQPDARETFMYNSDVWLEKYGKG